MNTNRPIMTPLPFDTDYSAWTPLNTTVGINNVQLRPQGNLPILNWGLTDKARKEMISLYFKVGSLIPTGSGSGSI